jgi:hypothetical protein
MEGTVVGEEKDTLTGPEAEMVATLRADASAVLKLLGIEKLVAPVALDPEIVRNLRFFSLVLERNRLEFPVTVEEASHRRLPLSRCQAAISARWLVETA